MGLAKCITGDLRRRVAIPYVRNLKDLNVPDKSFSPLAAMTCEFRWISGGDVVVSVFEERSYVFEGIVWLLLAYFTV